MLQGRPSFSGFGLKQEVITYSRGDTVDLETYGSYCVKLDLMLLFAQSTGPSH